MKKTLVLAIVAGVLSAAADIVGGSIYYVSTSTTIVDGDTFCGGGACTSADTIIIRGGARGSLKFQDFNGAGSYITITNENTNPDSKVVITSNGSGGWGVLSLSNCKYVDLRGDNDSDLAYGIKVINEDVAPRAGTVWVYGESDHIKLSYLEAMGKGTTSTSRIGILVNDSSLSSAWTFNDFEIHHNYIHDTRYCAMYLGPNWAQAEDNPYVSTFSIHNNTMEDLGSYGITFKSINGPNNYIYNNVVKRTGIVPDSTPTDSGKHGIGVQMTYNAESYVSIYDNWIEKTVGPGLKIGGTNHLAYNNTIVGCGSGNDPKWGHGICTHTYAENVELYDNIIIQPYQYGMYGGWATISVSHKRNLIGDAGVGEAGGINLTEGTCADVNIYYADVADFGFDVWSDDGDYSNDDFSLRNTSLLQIQQTGWSLVYVDSEETEGEDGRAINSFDGDPNTIWHTEWPENPPHPHEIQIDLGGFYDICRFCYLPRQGEYPNGMIKDYEFYVSSDSDNWGTAVASGTFVSDQTEKTVLFDCKLGRYVRLVVLSEVNDGPWTSMAELNVLAVRPDTDINDDGKVNIEDFAVLSVWWDDDGSCVEPGWCGGSDFDMSGTVDMLDLAYFAENWLRQ